MSMLLALAMVAGMKAGAVVPCENMPDGAFTLAASEHFDLEKLPAGELLCRSVDTGKNTVKRLLKGTIGGDEFMLDLSGAWGGVRGAKVPGQTYGADVRTDWLAECSYDATADRRLCLLNQQGIFVHKLNDLSIVRVGSDHRANSEIIFRVDDLEPIISTSLGLDEWPADVSISQMVAGRVLRTRYTSRAGKQHNAVISLKGFKTIYALMQHMDDAFIH